MMRLFLLLSLLGLTMLRPSKGFAPLSVPLSVVKSAVSQGAVCLDGSPPAYHLAAGKGDGVKNWMVYLQGGGWCINSTMHQTGDHSVESCSDRAATKAGSSFRMGPLNFTNIFSAHANESYFYNWNRVAVRYCDGGSFAGNAENPDPVTHLYHRGARIFQAVVNELMTRGMKDARNVLLAGGSSGGLGVMIHCDRFCGEFLKSVRVKCLADSSLFLRVKDPRRAMFFEDVFSAVVHVHHPDSVLPAGCTSKMSPAACFFPQNFLRYTKSPIFIVNPAFDSFQIQNTFSVDLYNQVKNHTVSRGDMSLLQDFRHQIMNGLPPAARWGRGYLITSLYGHSFGSQVGYKIPMFVNNTSRSIESVLVDWFYDRTPVVRLIDPADQPVYRSHN